MHPALSVIFFTTASGAGYGLLFLLGLVDVIAPASLNTNEALTALIVGLIFSSAGLLSSMLHLGRPERAWRAFSQWRSSWLSREGVMASFTYLPALLFGFLLWRKEPTILLRIDAGLLTFAAFVTVFCTARIYTSLKPIHAWHNVYVLPNYLLLGLLSGGLWYVVIGLSFGAAIPSWATIALMTLSLAAALLKLSYWHFLDNTHDESTPESATGLGRFGKVRSFERPHTEQNYLLKEMGYVLARKHSRHLRRLCLLLAFGLPICFLVAMLLLPHLELRLASGIIATLCATLGVLLERWLFFAEAKHLVTLYYDR